MPLRRAVGMAFQIQDDILDTRTAQTEAREQRPARANHLPLLAVLDGAGRTPHGAAGAAGVLPRRRGVGGSHLQRTVENEAD